MKRKIIIAAVGVLILGVVFVGLTTEKFQGGIATSENALSAVFQVVDEVENFKQ